MPGEQMPPYVAMENYSEGAPPSGAGAKQQQAPPTEQKQAPTNYVQQPPPSAYFQQPAGYGQQPGGYTTNGYDQQTQPPPYGQPGTTVGYSPQSGQPQFQPAGYGQPQNITIVTNAQTILPRPSNYLAFSIINCLCCNCILGIIAIVFSTMSSSEADVGNMEKARSHGKVALGLNIAGLILGVVVIIVMIVYFTLIWNAVAEDCNIYGDTFNCK